MSKLEDTLPSLVETVISAAESLEDERLETACEAFIAHLRRRPPRQSPG